MEGISGGTGVVPPRSQPSAAPPPALTPQQKERVQLESKRLGERVHSLFGGGSYNEALDVAEQQMRLLRENYGEGHHEYATSMNNVATLYQALGRHRDAEPLLQQASRVQERTLGGDHPHTVASLQNLATVYAAMGEQAMAESMNMIVKQKKASWEARLAKEKKGGRRR